MRSLCLLACFAVINLAAIGCRSSKEETEGEAPRGSRVSPTAEPKAPPSVRSELQSYRPLLAESARAELDVDGMLVDFGTADQHKFTRGGWRTGWGKSVSADGVNFAQVTGGTATVEGIAQSQAAELVVRARSPVGGQRLAVWIDGTMLGEEPVSSEWSLLRFPIKTPLEPGRREILLRFRKGGSPRAEVEWLWLAADAGADPPLVVPRIIPVNIGGAPRRSLVAPSTRRYSFYLEVPEDASLVFDYASDKPVDFTVRVEPTGGEPEVVFGPEKASEWKEARVDLAAFAGRAVRLELATDGPPGLTGWGEPEIMVAQNGDPPAPPGADTAKNLVFILIDTTRADSYGDFGPVTVAPEVNVRTAAFDALAEKSTVFVNAYNNENWTKPSVATTLSGLYPVTHDTKTDAVSLPKEVLLLPEHLKKEGFTTASFIANGYISDRFGFKKGWDHYTNYIRESRATQAEHVYREALEWVKENKDQRFFAYIQTIDPHVVYRARKEYTAPYFEGEYRGPLGMSINAEKLIAITKGTLKVSDRDMDWLKAVYWGEVAYHDDHMGEFLRELETLGLMDDTMFVVTNDHGEELLEHGRLGHGQSLYEELIRAPLIMSYPPLFPTRKVEEVVEHVDLVPTITEALGLKPMAAAEGQSLLPIIHGQPYQRPSYAIAEFLDGQRAVRVGGWKLIRTPGTRVNLFHIAEDRAEQNDLVKAGGHHVAQRLCEVYLGEGLATPDKSQRQRDITTRRQLKAGKADIDPETRRQLEALGYFGDDHRPDPEEEQ